MIFFIQKQSKFDPANCSRLLKPPSRNSPVTVVTQQYHFFRNKILKYLNPDHCILPPHGPFLVPPNSERNFGILQLQSHSTILLSDLFLVFLGSKQRFRTNRRDSNRTMVLSGVFLVYSSSRLNFHDPNHVIVTMDREFSCETAHATVHRAQDVASDSIKP